MDTSKLKSFAPAVRRKLHEAIERKLDFVLAAQTVDLRTTYEKQVVSLREKNKQNRKALIEGAAYTWFNRFTALRYLDAQGWHPFNAKILMPAAPGEVQPEILKMVNAGSMPDELKDYVDQKRVIDLLNRNIPSQNPEQEVYRLLVLGACRFYHSILKTIFAKLDDETELLLPDDLLGDLSVLAGFRTEINDEDCDDVEVIGWLYQFYISDEKDKVIERKSAVPTEDIPAVTQLFTPHWIVRYITENSLGRLWMLNRPNSGLKKHMPYYIEGEAETDFIKIIKPEEIKIVDPAVGSGHMLTYAFDLLYLIYEEEGYPTNDIASLILKHNLHGIEICPRAAQLAELALSFKARKKTRRFFQPGVFVRPQITELQEIRFSGDELREYIKELGLGSLFDQAVIKLLHQFEESKNFGSLIQPCLDEKSIGDTRRAIEAKDLGGHLFLRETHLKVLRVLEQAEALTQRYHVVAANPPYMGKKGMNGTIKQFLQENFANYNSDLFSAFIVRTLTLAFPNGYLGFMSPFVWMFISSYEGLRKRLLSEATITTLVQLEYSGFDGATVPICTFALQNKHKRTYRGAYIKLTDFRGSENQGPKTLEAIRNQNCGWFFLADGNNFEKIHGSPIAYWASPRLLSIFKESPSVGELYKIACGLFTCDNGRFIRNWWEVAFDKCNIEKSNTNSKWKKHIKGGSGIKWHTAIENIVNYGNNGEEIRAHRIKSGQSYSLPGEKYYGKRGVALPLISSSSFSARMFEEGNIFDISANSAFEIDIPCEVLTALLCSRVGDECIKILCPTLNFTPGDIAKVPLNFHVLESNISLIRELCSTCIDISRFDFDSQETTFTFGEQPLLRPSLKDTTLETSWQNWEAQSTTAIRRMQELETENNTLFINAYGLDGELQPEVPEDQITLARADAKKDMAAFLSYAVGCMMGRYSLDAPGLILANAEDTLEQYFTKVGKTKEALQFQPDDDGILPIMDVEWFEDDIVARVEAFLVSTFGADKLNENTQFIEKSLGTDIRSYFLSGFYKDHLQTYKKRPIYWMAQSPKKAFCALIYLHRYTKDTLSILLNSYLRPYIVKLNSRIEILSQTEASAGTTREKTAARKELEKLRKYVRECQEWERDVLLPAAQSRIDLDLDDGVKVNYLKLGDVLTPIAGMASKEDE